ncbi:uncharacterized protein HD556DRAFT_1345649 [Suillus plorans]|uniref:Uncharacterized protein n=1 Tax=Suillus plorans TaxID=116603 RepID=A0A9P7J2Q7_9AGAM|nr:uncharacterized protein HD556DRAFT_1345649 [Suillus plorans]KAG1799884.1 hypothetical protein HD556DRAFT_1345649 [Suillus plorans]
MYNDNLAHSLEPTANLALVMAPNLLRCNPESMTTLANVQYAQVRSNCVPIHGLGASLPSPPQPRVCKSRNRK